MQAQVVTYLRQPSFSKLVDVLLTGISDEEFGSYIGEISFEFRTWRGFTNKIGIIWIDGVEFIDCKEFETVIITYPFVLKYFSDTVIDYIKEISYQHKEVFNAIKEESIQRNIRKGRYGGKLINGVGVI